MRLVRALLIACVAVGAWVAPAAANGLPTPFPGVSTGPDGAALRQIAEGYGLTCQDFPGGIAPEVSCNNAAGNPPLLLSVIFYTTPALVMAATATGPAPLADQAQAFMTDLTLPFCTPESAELFVADALARPTPPERLHLVVPGNCELWAVSNVTSGRGFMFLDAFEGSVGAVASLVPIVTPGLLPSPGPSASPAPVVTAAPAPGPLVAPTPGAFAGSIVKPAALPLDSSALIQSLALTLLALLLIPFPGQLFNSTLDENADEVRGWFRWIRLPAALRRGDLWRSPVGITLFIAIASVLYALLDPGLGLNLASLAEVVGFAFGIVLTTAVFSLPSLLIHRRAGDDWKLTVLPLSLVVGAVCVLISRLTSFEPGYLYGLLLGLTFARDLDKAGEGRSISIAVVVMVVAALIAWVLLGVVGDSGDIVGIALRTALASTMVGGLEGAALGLLPLRFQPGERVWSWNRLIWGALFAASMFLFVLLLVNPASGYLADSGNTPLVTIIALLVGFGAVSIAFWGYFRFRPARPLPPDPEPQG